MTKSVALIGAVVAFGALVGCGSGTAAPSTTAANVMMDQAAQGKALYAARCASCHGAQGQGTAKAPAVVGPRALPLEPPPGAKLRKFPFRTAADVYAWVRQNMPADAPGSLSDAEYAAILAYALNANGVRLAQPLDGDNAGSIVLHP